MITKTTIFKAKKIVESLTDKDGKASIDEHFIVHKATADIDLNGHVCKVLVDDSAYYFDVVQSLKQVIADIESEHKKSQPVNLGWFSAFFQFGFKASFILVAALGLIKWIL